MTQSRGLSPLVPRGEQLEHQSDAVFDAEADENAFEISPHGGNFQPHLGGDPLVAAVAEDQLENAKLLRREIEHRREFAPLLGRKGKVWKLFFGHACDPGDRNAFENTWCCSAPGLAYCDLSWALLPGRIAGGRRGDSQLPRQRGLGPRCRVHQPSMPSRAEPPDRQTACGHKERRQSGPVTEEFAKYFFYALRTLANVAFMIEAQFGRKRRPCALAKMFTGSD